MGAVKFDGKTNKNGEKVLATWLPAEFVNSVHEYVIKKDKEKSRMLRFKIKDMLYEAVSTYMAANPLEDE